VTERARLSRDALKTRLGERGIGTGVYYPRPVFDHVCFRGDPRIGSPPMPMTERASREVLSLPVHPLLTHEDLDLIVRSVKEALA
jgi:dTDP-4-amino-4,6-dideoxygalactose transaminase